MKVKYLMFEACPFCKKAEGFMQELYAENPAYQAIEIEKIDERLQPELASQFNYYYVPTFYVGKQKVFEGAPSIEDIRLVFDTALKQAEK